MDLSQRQQRAIVGVVVVVLAIALGSVIAVALDVGPFAEETPSNGGVGKSDEADTPPPTGTVYTRGGGENVTQQPAFEFDITNIEKCGQTCRDVTIELRNTQNRTAANVTVFTRIYAGNNTKQENQIWEGEEFVGTMNASETVTKTQRVELSTQEGFAVKQEDGWITIVTTIRSDGTTITFKERRDVA